MIHERIRVAVPLSPPSSPRMSKISGKPTNYPWQHHAVTSNTSKHGLVSQSAATAAGAASSGQYAPADSYKRPCLKDHRGYPYPLGTSNLPHEVRHPSSNASTLRDGDPGFMPQVSQLGSTSADASATNGASAPTSPVGRLTPRSSGPEPGDMQTDDEDVEEDGDQDDDEERPEMTAAELRAAKRKMKRFRLSHQQTRFLMSEFARQAHPDSAHRERLSREIPGLSSRQVQVWFQNRRAKLKRMTSDDQERVMRSRALPPNFDMTRALHSPFGVQSSSMGATAPASYATYGESCGIRPLTLETLRRIPDYETYGQQQQQQQQQQYTSPGSIGSTSDALGALAFTPPHSATDTLSPSSAPGTFNYHRQPQESPRQVPYGMPTGGQQNYAVPRLPLHDRLVKPIGEPAGSPLRSGMSYPGLGLNSVPFSQSLDRGASFPGQHGMMQERPQEQYRSATGPSVTGASPYGVSYSSVTYPQQGPYQTNEQQPPTTVTSAAVAPQHYEPQPPRHAGSGMSGSTVHANRPYHSGSYNAQPQPAYSQYPAQYEGQGFQSPYHQQQQPSEQDRRQQIQEQPRRPGGRQHHHLTPGAHDRFEGAADVPGRGPPY